MRRTARIVRNVLLYGGEVFPSSEDFQPSGLQSICLANHRYNNVTRNLLQRRIQTVNPARDRFRFPNRISNRGLARWARLVREVANLRKAYAPPGSWPRIAARTSALHSRAQTSTLRLLFAIRFK